jgi:hypothetical protein
MSPRAGYLLIHQVVPRLRAVIPRSVQTVGCENHEELVADATCMAAKIMDQAENNGKAVAASSVAYYAIQHSKAGRRAVGHSSCDVHGTATQLHGRSRLESLEEVVAVDEITGGEVYLYDVLSNDNEDPGTRAARKMDWETFMAGLSARDQSLVLLMIEGKTVSGMAKKLKVSDWTVRKSKESLGLKILEHMGDTILADIQRSPRWKHDLEAVKEKIACKYDRIH